MIYSSPKLFSLLFSLALSALLLFAPSESVSLRQQKNDHMQRLPSSSSSLLSSSSSVHRSVWGIADKMRTLAESSKATDPACEGVDCNGNGKCVDGKCVCSGGFGGPNCDVSPSVIITNITLPQKIGSKANVRWTSTGSFKEVSVFLFPNDPAKIFGSQVFPTYIRRDVPNTGSFDWTVSMALSGSVKVGVAFNPIVAFYSVSPLFVEDPCGTVVDCGANGVCFQGQCRCKSGFTGSRCEINQCPADQCNGRGTCDKGVCTCNAGFKGTRCEINTQTCKGSCDNGGIMDPTCTRCTCTGAWGNAGCRTCQLQCPANTRPDDSCTQCICTPGWAGIQCNVPFATVQFKITGVTVESFILPPTAPSELRPLADATLKSLKVSLAQDIAYALQISSDRVNITETLIDTSVTPRTVLIVTAQLLAEPNDAAAAVTVMVNSLKTQAANQTIFADSRLALGQMSSKIDLKANIDYKRDQSADGGGFLGDIQSEASRFWIFLLAGGGAVVLVIASIAYYRYRRKQRMNLTKTVNQLNEVTLGTGNDAPVQRSGAKGYEMPTANAAFPSNSNNNTGTTQQFSATTALNTVNTSSTAKGLATTKKFGKNGFPASGTVGGRNKEWTIFYTDGGDPYWYNNQNGVSLWEQPSDF